MTALKPAARFPYTLRTRMATAKVRLLALSLFVGLVALTGGGSRADITSLIVLRPMAVLFGAYALLVMPPNRLRSVRFPLILLLSAVLVVGWQLIPLPSSLWHELPGRALIGHTDALLGWSDLWRPAAMSPAGAWNVLFSLFVPIAALLLFAAVDPSDRKVLLLIWLAVAFASSILGLMQLLGPPDGPLYSYAVTNGGVSVGLFSNANHQSAFLATSIPVATLWGYRRPERRKSRWLAALAAALLFALVAILTGSRSGIVLTALALILAALTLGGQFTKEAYSAASTAGTSGNLAVTAKRRLGLIASGLIVLLLVVAGSLMASLQNVGGVEAGGYDWTAELRFEALPTILQLIGTYWPIGSGGGSFAAVYKIAEPTSLLSNTYLNQAHNDWIQIVLEHGLLGLVLLAAFVIMVLRAGLHTLRQHRGVLLNRITILAPPAMFAVASVLDYPLRTPILQVLLICWVVVMQQQDSTSSSRRPLGKDGLRQ